MKKPLLILSGVCSLTFSFAQPAVWNSRGVGGGGALFSPSFNPANPNEYYISCDMSELFHTTNLGQAYNQVHFDEFVGGHNSKVCFTSTANLLYSIAYVADIGTPVKSTDNGVTWNPLAGNPDPNEDIYTIHVDYANSNRVIISDYNAIHYSTNGGTTFTQIHTALTGSGNVVGGVFFDGNNIYIGTNDGVLFSINSGTNWSTAVLTGIPAGEAIWSFSAAKSGPTTRFFCLTGDPADIYVGLQGSDYWGFYRGIYTCDYGVTNWTSASTGITANDYPMFIGMAENNITTAYISGSNDNSEPIVMKTTNVGGNWSHVLLTTSNQNVTTG
ncbi:MAG: WD40/YVTN/BNR-like repeat-containing protein, partial [Flavobacteriales bacterium]